MAGAKMKMCLNFTNNSFFSLCLPVVFNCCVYSYSWFKSVEHHVLTWKEVTFAVRTEFWSVNLICVCFNLKKFFNDSALGFGQLSNLNGHPALIRFRMAKKKMNSLLKYLLNTKQYRVYMILEWLQKM